MCDYYIKHLLHYPSLGNAANMSLLMLSHDRVQMWVSISGWISLSFPWQHDSILPWFISMQVAQIFFYHCFQHHCGKELSIKPHLLFLSSASHFVGICVLSLGTIPIFAVTVCDWSHGLLKGIYSNKCLYLEKKPSQVLGVKVGPKL